MNQQLLSKINEKTAHIGVIGLGYVGLPLATGLGKVGYRVTGVDVSAAKTEQLMQGSSYIPDVPSADLAHLREQNLLTATTDFDSLKETDVIFICVPTPFDAMKSPDLTYVRQAAEAISTRLQAGQLVVLQSTTYPGTTEEVVQPILEQSGLKAGDDFFVAFSPERIDPGRQDFTVENTPKVVGGITPESTELAAQLLATLTPSICVVSSPRAAEMTKLLENIFRSVNIALVNELAILSERMDIDIWEVIEAAKTKPFGFMPFYPGPGVGGHCIPVDPYYLAWKAREYDFNTRFIELAAEVNGAMPYHTVDLIIQSLNHNGKSLQGSTVLVMGVAFKPNIDDARNSPAQRVIELLLKSGAEVRYHDPFVPQFFAGGSIVLQEKIILENSPLTTETVEAADCVAIVTGHRTIDYGWLLQHSSAVVDTVNITKNLTGMKHKVVRLGALP